MTTFSSSELLIDLGISSYQRDPASGGLSHLPIRPPSMSERKPLHLSFGLECGRIQSTGPPRPPKFSPPNIWLSFLSLSESVDETGTNSGTRSGRRYLI